MRKYFRTLVTCKLLVVSIAHGQGTNLLKAGPMVGYSAMSEVALWVQTTAPATVYFEYWEKDAPQKRYRTESYTTKKSQAYTAKLIADQVQHGKKYAYELFINGKRVVRDYPLEFQTQTLWHYRTDPPPFKFALGSCSYINDSINDRPGKPYGDHYSIFTRIYEQKPDFMLWMGDNVYLREPDLDSKTGIFYRYTHTRSVKELQPLLGSVHHYAIWDDHEYGPNDSDASYSLKHYTEEAFKLFWANPNYGPGTDGKGISGTFQWADAEFFLLDNRYFRTANDNHILPRQLLGEPQLNWLINALIASKATFKFVVIGCQVLNPAQVFENYSTYPEERARLLKAIREANIKGVFFLSGDRHHTELTMLQENNRVYPLYDLTVSPLTAGPATNVNEPNTLRVPGTMVNDRNFATIEVTGPRNDRKMTIRVFDYTGKQHWSKEITAKEISSAR
ncbi:MAG: alkaline phosphatase D family protein [Cytophagales bacterium]|nr:alkaline phosphatase family protein [Bernardetiaceae bacterium]MDW8211662.1 alkaline phosphatase D family protein [Cytophagales bacterium]